MAQKPPESKQGLVITLIITWVFFVIPLGVTTYFGFADKQIEVDKAKKADTELKSMKDDRDGQKYAQLQFRTSIGLKLSKEESESFAVARGKYEGDMTKAAGVDAGKQIGELEKDERYGWDRDKKEPRTPLLAYIDKKERDLAARIKEVEKTQTELKEMNDRFEEQKKINQQEKAKFDALVKKVNDDSTGSLKGYRDKIDAQQKQIDEGSAALTEAAKVAADKEKKLNDQIALLGKSLREVTKNLEQKEAQVETLIRVDILAKDQPKGKVLSIDRSGMPIIDLGSADNVRAPLTFNVVGVGPDGLPLKERKATIEVVNVLSDRRSLTRVTTVKDGDRDPILPGDLLFNPAWSPSLKQHVAIAGAVDLTGDGIGNNPEVQMRNLREFIRNLKAQNIEVDAYMDMKTMKIEGTITRNTDFLVLGEPPDLAGGGILKDAADAKNDRNTKLSALYNEMQKVAKDNAVNQIKFKNFLVATGYKLPRPLTGEGSSYISRSQGAPSGTPATPPIEDKKPK